MYYNEKIELVRNSKNITQKEIAEYLGIKQQQYARYEKGVNIMPVTYLNISADDVLGIEKKKKEKIHN